MKNIPFDFHGAEFTIKILTSESNGIYTVLDVFHPPNLGPGLHMHPKGPETFYIIEGTYDFFVDGKIIPSKSGDVVFVPKGIPHRFVVGKDGGHAIVISPPNLEFYFFEVSKMLEKGNVSYDVESSIGRQYGQILLDKSKHWS